VRSAVAGRSRQRTLANIIWSSEGRSGGTHPRHGGAIGRRGTWKGSA
jgi:hypothetical protein